MVSETVSLTRHGLGDRRVSLQLSLDPADRLVVRGNRERVGQVLTNIVLNAVQATPDEGQVTVSAQPRDGQAVVTVHNTGSFIPPDVRRQLFVPFFTTKPTGTGLGLAIARQIVTALDGRIEVESDPSLGNDVHDRVAHGGERGSTRMTSIYQLLVVDDDPQMQFFLKEALERQQYVVRVKGSAEAALDTLKAERFDLILMDVRLPGMSGLDAVDEIQKADRRTPIIIMTAHGTRDSALDAVRRGAYDYFTKPFSLDEMEIIVRRALEKKRLLAELDRLSQQLAASRRRGRIVGSSRAMEEVLRLIDRVGPTDSTVLILGESGTGKELIAEAIHEHSTRSGRPFVKLNCAAIPETLLESELFGHEKGAFTGAVSRKLGKFEQADGGTLLLDEIGDMTLATQAKILRALQERELQRVGGTQTIKVDVRIIASTNKDLEQAVTRRHVPRRPLLPAERGDAAGAAAARSPRRDPGARRPFPRRSQHPAEAQHPAARARYAGRAHGVRLAGQRARAAQHDRAGRRRQRRRRAGAQQLSAADPAGRAAGGRRPRGGTRCRT